MLYYSSNHRMGRWSARPRHTTRNHTSTQRASCDSMKRMYGRGTRNTQRASCNRITRVWGRGTRITLPRWLHCRNTYARHRLVEFVLCFVVIDVLLRAALFRSTHHILAWEESRELSFLHATKKKGQSKNEVVSRRATIQSPCQEQLPRDS